MKFTREHIELVEWVATKDCAPRRIASLVKLIFELPEPPPELSASQIVERKKELRRVRNERYRDKIKNRGCNNS
jgi:hypothetical protein